MGISFQTLKTNLQGELIEPGRPGYEAARKVHNGMIDRRPAAIARCASVADVAACVNFARDNGVLLAIRAGGHSAPGLGVCDGGLVADLSPMKEIRVDAGARTARAQGGCTWGELDTATHVYGMATPGGIISTTGVAGLTLGGGIGHLTRRCGLSIDNLLEAEMVLADGSTARASAKENADLFWAIRGGGGNFGVVTSFLFRLHPVKIVQAGPTLWPIDQAADAMRFYREFIRSAPEDLNGFFAFIQVPPAPPFPEHLHHQTMCGVVWHYSGPEDELESRLAPLRAFRKPAFEHIGPVPHPAVQSMFDPLYPHGLQQYWRADFFAELNDEAVRAFVEHGSRLPTLLSTIHLYPIDGAAHRAGIADTAFSYRHANWAGVIVGIDADPANNEKTIPWVKQTFDAVHPYSAGGAYVNFMMDEGQERVRATYGANYDRLAAIKAKYDPANLFRVNQNIHPAAARAA